LRLKFRQIFRKLSIHRNLIRLHVKPVTNSLVVTDVVF